MSVDTNLDAPKEKFNNELYKHVKELTDDVIVARLDAVPEVGREELVAWGGVDTWARESHLREVARLGPPLGFRGEVCEALAVEGLVELVLGRHSVAVKAVAPGWETGGTVLAAVVLLVAVALGAGAGRRGLDVAQVKQRKKSALEAMTRF